MKLNRSKAHGPEGILGWVLKENADLLAAPIADILNSSHRIKLSRDCFSELEAVPAGIPQGTKLGWLFYIMINDLSAANTKL